MLIRQGILYFFARGLPGLVNLATLMIFTRLLPAQAYGQYALIMAAVILGHSVLYQWLQQGLLRFYIAHPKQQHQFLGTVFYIYLAISILIAGTATACSAFLQTPTAEHLLAIAVIVLCLHAFHELNLQLSVVKGQPKYFAFYGFLKSALGLACGVLFIYQGLSVAGALLGILAGLTSTCVLGLYRDWPFPARKHFRRQILRELLHYGLPLIASSALAYLISNSDRFMLAYLINVEAAGKYAAGYDLASYTLIVLMVIINTAAYPLAVKALEEKGAEPARKQLAANFTLLWAIALPSSVGLALLASPIAQLLLGEEFRIAASALIPWIAMAVLLNGLKAFYFDISFQFGKKTGLQFWSVLLAVLLNLVLNYLWIPKYGMQGAAFASIAAFTSAILVSYALGRKIFPLPIPWADTFKIILATLFMAAALISLPVTPNLAGLVLSIAAGSLVYTSLILLLDVAHCQHYIKSLLRR